MKLFNSEYQELGSTDQNLVLNTSGKIKIRYGKKYFDLLDKDGNLNISNLVQTVNNEDSIKQNGIYVCNDKLYVYANGKRFKLKLESDG